jgi:GTP-binding protein
MVVDQPRDEPTQPGLVLPELLEADRERIFDRGHTEIMPCPTVALRRARDLLGPRAATSLRPKRVRPVDLDRARPHDPSPFSPARPAHMPRDTLRNIAIIAHVDHGKTTLVDGLLKQTGTFRQNQAVGDCIMDSNELEKERGITILAKNTVVTYKGVKINIIDTPGHADFGGEVERVLSMADGVLLLVDAAEGPMPQTRFVLSKAFLHKLIPIVVINKVDRTDARAQEVVNEVFDLFIDLDRERGAARVPGPLRLRPRRLDVAGPEGQDRGPRAAVRDDPRAHPGAEGRPLGAGAVPRVLARLVRLRRPHRDRPRAPRQAPGRTAGHARAARRQAEGGARARHLHVLGHDARRGAVGRGRRTSRPSTASRRSRSATSLCDLERVEPLPVIAIDEPTMTILMRVNDSPFAGKEGEYVTSRHLRERLEQGAAHERLRCASSPARPRTSSSSRPRRHAPRLPARDMRREGYEFAVGKPEVISTRRTARRRSRSST